MAYNNNLSGVLFKNDKKQEGDNQPWYKGKLEIDGITYELAAWVSKSKVDGKPFLSLKAQLPRDQNHTPESPPMSDDGNLPF